MKKLIVLVIVQFAAFAHAQVPITLFGAGVNKNTTVQCYSDGNNQAAQLSSIRVGWDNGTKWGQIQPTNTTPTWTTLDSLTNTRALGTNARAGINVAIGANCPGTATMNTIYTFGDTPQWASAGAVTTGGPCASPDTTYSCSPPASLNGDGTGTDVEYNSIVAALVARYASNSAAQRLYEIWNEADSNNFWCWNDVVCGGTGSANSPLLHANVPSLNNLVRMGWDLKHIAACLDPTAKILSPSFHVGTALTWFHNYNITSISAPAGVSGVNGVPIGCNWNAATVTGKQTYDYVNVHARGTTVAFPDTAGNWNPAAIITAYNNTVTEIANDSLPNPTVIFNDEFGFNTSLQGGSNSTGYSAHIAQEYIYCASLAFAQCHWYQWDTTTLGPQGMLWGTAFDTVAGWLIGATITVPCATVANITTCGLTKGGVTELIAWDTSKYATTCCLAPANQTYGALYNFYIDLTGARRVTTGSGVAPTGWSPILLQQLGVTPAAPTSISGRVTVSGTAVIH